MQKCNIDNLKELDGNYIHKYFTSPQINTDWEKINNNSLFINLPKNNQGINSGDQRAIYYLIKGLKLESVLEVGTHIGVSTFYFAKALKEINKDFSLVTIDIIDVNDQRNKHWENFGATISPLRILKNADLLENVEFVKSNSVHYMKNCTQKFDLIFLDGSHKAEEVYNEIPLALDLINPKGIILLHDYYPDKKPIWNDDIIIPGPYLAVERYINEGVDIKIIPLDELPWETKNNTNLSSLAMLTKR